MCRIHESLGSSLRTEWRKKWDKWLCSFTNAVLCSQTWCCSASVHFWMGSVLLSVSAWALSFSLFSFVCFCMGSVLLSVCFRTGSFLLSVSFCLFLSRLFSSVCSWMGSFLQDCLAGTCYTGLNKKSSPSSWGFPSLSSELLRLYLPAEQCDGCLGTFDLREIPVEGTFCPQVLWVVFLSYSWTSLACFEVRPTHLLSPHAMSFALIVSSWNLPMVELS